MPIARSAVANVVTTDRSFFTTFPANENPISQGGIWLGGHDDGLDWQNCKTTNATDGIHRVCGSVTPISYDDPTAILKSSFRAFHNDQYVETTVYRQSGYTPSSGTYDECEHRLRSAISANSCTGYEVLYALNDPGTSGDGYAVVKWLGPVGAGGFTTIYNGGSGSLPVIQDGDVFRSSVIGTTLYVYRNGVLVNSHDLTKDQFGSTISVWTSGQPGFGFFPAVGNPLDTYGWKTMRADDLS